jgi:hypothetical protein
MPVQLVDAPSQSRRLEQVLAKVVHPSLGFIHVLVGGVVLSIMVVLQPAAAVII